LSAFEWEIVAPEVQVRSAAVSSVSLPLARAVRLPFVAGLAGAVAGLLGLGLGLRVAMRLIALLNQDDFVFTENGNVVGEITLSGTLGVVIAGGIGGVFLGLLYGIVRSWLPSRGWRRGTFYGALLSAAFGTFLVDSESLDFALLDHDAISIALLLACPVLFGTMLGALVDRLEPHEPRLLRLRPIRIGGTLLVAAVSAVGLVQLVDAVREILA
jgi:hypothetical protein